MIQFHDGPHTRYIHSPDWSVSSFSCASLIFSCNSSFCFFVRSCAMFILLNGTSDSLILFKFSHFLSSSFSEMSSGQCLSSIALPSLIMCSIMLLSKLTLIMPLQNPTNFLISSSFLSSGSDFFDSGSQIQLCFFFYSSFPSPHCLFPSVTLL